MGEQAVRVEDDDRLGMHPENAPDPHLQQFLQGAKTAGEGEEGVRADLQEPLALPHRLGDDQLVRVAVGDFQGRQRSGNHAGSAGGARTGRAGDRTHARDGAATRNQAVAAAGERGTDRRGQLEVGGIDRLGRRAVDTDVHAGSPPGRPASEPGWSLPTRWLLTMI